MRPPAPSDVHVPTPETCDYVTWCGQGTPQRWSCQGPCDGKAIPGYPGGQSEIAGVLLRKLGGREARTCHVAGSADEGRAVSGGCLQKPREHKDALSPSLQEPSPADRSGRLTSGVEDHGVLLHIIHFLTVCYSSGKKLIHCSRCSQAWYPRRLCESRDLRTGTQGIPTSRWGGRGTWKEGRCGCPLVPGSDP